VNECDPTRHRTFGGVFKRAELQELFAANRRLFKAYVMREELDQLWKYATPRGVANVLWGWVKALRWQRLPEMEKLGRFLVDHHVLPPLGN